MRSGSIVLLASLGLSIVWARSSQSSQGKRPASAPQAGLALAYAPCDYDRDGRIDHLLFGPNSAGRLIANLGEGKTEDRTGDALLEGLGFVSQAHWRDLDNDRWQDLIVLSPEGFLRVFSGNGQAFEETTAALAGIPCASVQAVDFEDYDLNGWLDVRVQCLDGSRTVLFNSGNHQFVPGEDPLAFLGSSGGSQAAFGLPPGCSGSIEDQSSPASCLSASSIPTLGRLYMMSSSLFVAAAGQVGVLTSMPDPAFALDVDGVINARQGIRLPDESILLGAIPAGGEGPQGPEGPEGPPGPIGQLPAGAIMLSAASTAPPGFLLCDGSLFDPGTYPDLALSIGMAYGGGTEFRVPDLTQRFPIGATNASNYMLADSGGALDHTHDVDAHAHVVPGHGHGFSLATNQNTHSHGLGTLTTGTTGSGHSHGVTGGISADGAHTHGIKFKSTGPTTGGAKKLAESPLSNWDGIDGDQIQSAGAHTHPHTIGTNSTGSGHTHNVTGTLGNDSHSHTVTGSVGSGLSGDANFNTNLGGGTTTSSSNPPYLALHFIIKT